MKNLHVLCFMFLFIACGNPSEPESSDPTDTMSVTSSTTKDDVPPTALPHASDSATQPPISGGSETLFEFLWSLVTINGEEVRTGATGTVPQLAFFPGQISRVTGTTGCNRFTGNFEIAAENKLKFLPLATTKMTCMDDNIESKFLAALYGVDQFSIGKNNSLLLLKSGKTVMEFSGKPAH